MKMLVSNNERLAKAYYLIEAIMSLLFACPL